MRMSTFQLDRTKSRAEEDGSKDITVDGPDLYVRLRRQSESTPASFMPVSCKFSSTFFASLYLNLYVTSYYLCGCSGLLQLFLYS